jgi:hypothetical protein
LPSADAAVSIVPAPAVLVVPRFCNVPSARVRKAVIVALPAVDR